jgi:hypothetical protein
MPPRSGFSRLRVVNAFPNSCPVSRMAAYGLTQMISINFRPRTTRLSKARGIAAVIAKLPELVAERYCGQLRSPPSATMEDQAAETIFAAIRRASSSSLAAGRKPSRRSKLMPSIAPLTCARAGAAFLAAAPKPLASRVKER